MDQVKIGKFIKQKRKEKKLTQMIWTPFLGHGNEVFICQN